jgi:hypothetical protein
MPDFISAEVEPLPDRANQAARALQQLGFHILHTGTTLSVEAPESLWVSTFNVSFEQGKKGALPEVVEADITYRKPVVKDMRIPAGLQDSVADVMFSEPPDFY